MSGSVSSLAARPRSFLGKFKRALGYPVRPADQDGGITHKVPRRRVPPCQSYLSLARDVDWGAPM